MTEYRYFRGAPYEEVIQNRLKYLEDHPDQTYEEIGVVWGLTKAAVQAFAVKHDIYRKPDWSRYGANQYMTQPRLKTKTEEREEALLRRKVTSMSWVKTRGSAHV